MEGLNLLQKYLKEDCDCGQFTEEEKKKIHEAERNLYHGPPPPPMSPPNPSDAYLIMLDLGYGDNLNVRPTIRYLVDEGVEPLYILTPYPELYHDMFDDLEFVYRKMDSSLAQKNVDSFPADFWSEPPGGFTLLTFKQYQFFLNRDITLSQAMEYSIIKRFIPADKFHYSFDVPPCWIKDAVNILSDLKIGNKKICLVKPPTLQTDELYYNVSRNAKMEYFQLLVDNYKDDYFFVSTAAVDGENEVWYDQELVGTDVSFYNAELSLRILFGMCKLVDMVLTSNCFMLHMALAAEARTFVLYGGCWAPNVVVDSRIKPKLYSYAAPDPFCNCRDYQHNCYKDIDPKVVLENFEELKNR